MIAQLLPFYVKKIGLLALAAFLLSLSASHIAKAQSADAILGKWLSGTGKAHIEIYKDGSKYFGKIVWLKTPLTPEGKPKLDIKNPQEGLRDRPLLGLVNLSNFAAAEDATYEDGKIYDPETGKTYSCVMTLKEANTLAVRGYIGISLIGRTDTWQRVK